MSGAIIQFSGRWWFLSNFYPSPIEHRIEWAPDDYVEATFATAEHAYQASKAQDARQVARVLRALTPGDAKRFGSRLAIRPNWDAMRLDVMRQVVRAKFTQHDDLAEMLVLTGDRELVEGNTWGDRYWGACDGRGENWLGKILMEQRKALVRARR